MMRRPETAKLIKEALNSPVGSTSRAKAKKIFSIVNKLNVSHDGSGGPGMYYDRMAYGPQMAPEMDPMHIPTDNSKGMVIFRKIPTPKITYGNKASKFQPRAGSFDGSGGPGLVRDGEGGFWGDAWGSFKDLLNLAPVANAPAENANSVSGPGTTSTYLQASSGPNLQGAWESPTSTSYGSNSTSTSAIPKTNGPIYGPKPVAPKTDPGLLSKLATGVANIAAPVAGFAGKTLASIPLILAKGGQWGAQNIYSGARELFPHEEGSLPYINMNDTWAGKKMNEMWKSSTPAQTGTSTPTTSSTTLPKVPTESSTGTISTTGGDVNLDTGKKVAPSAGTGALTPEQIAALVATLPKTNAATITSGSGTTGAGTTGAGTSTSGAGTTVTTTENGLPSSTTGAGSAALNWSKGLGVSPESSLSSIIESNGLPSLITQIIKNEGGSLAGVQNNPGNIKFAGLPGQTNSGVSNDGGKSYFASYATPEAGVQAIANIVTNAAAGKSSAYGANPTLQSFANTYTDTYPGGTSGAGSTAGTGPAGYTGALSADQLAMQTALKAGTGPGMATLNRVQDPTNPVTKGLTMQEEAEANKKSIWSSYDLDKKKTEIDTLKAEQLQLPKDMTDYIVGRDQYVKETNKKIDDYINITMKNMDMSNPNNVNTANKYLDYLYLLKGRQNKSYAGFLNQAVDQHQQMLDKAVTDYNSLITVATDELNSKNAITEAKYTSYMAALADMYTTLDGAPLKAYQAELLRLQSIGADADSVAAAAKKAAEQSYIGQIDEIKKTGMIDSGVVLQNPENFDIIATLDRLEQDAPELLRQNIFSAYINGLNNYLGAMEYKDDMTGKGITSTTKINAAKNAMSQLKMLAEQYAPSYDSSGKLIDPGDPISYNSAVAAAKDMANWLGAKETSKLLGSGKAPLIMEAVKELAPNSGIWPFRGPGAPPTEAEFIKIVTNKTKDPTDESIARAIYKIFSDYVSAEKGSVNAPSNAVNALLNDMSSVNKMVPLTEAQFASNIGGQYAKSLVP